MSNLFTTPPVRGYRRPGFFFSLDTTEILIITKATWNWTGAQNNALMVATLLPTKATWLWDAKALKHNVALTITKGVWPAWSGKNITFSFVLQIAKAVWNWSGKNMDFGGAIAFLGNLVRLDMTQTVRRQIGFKVTNIERDFPGDGQE